MPGSRRCCARHWRRASFDHPTLPFPHSVRGSLLKGTSLNIRFTRRHADTFLRTRLGMFDPPSWLNWLSIITGISGVTISTIVGWIIDGVPPREPRFYQQHTSQDRNGTPVKRQPSPPRLSLLDEVRWALFKLIVRPDLPISTHLGVIIGSIALIVASYLHVFGGSGAAPNLPVLALLSKAALIGLVLLGLMVAFLVARLRWRMRYKSWRHSQEYGTDD